MGSTGKAVNVITTDSGQVVVTPFNESPEAAALANGEQISTTEEEPTQENVEDAELIKSPSNDENDLEGVATLTANGEYKWFNNPKLSNHAAWYSDLSQKEKEAINYYVSSSYQSLNDELYGISWDDMSSTKKSKAAQLFSAINKFELNKSINLLRKCDFQIFGLAKGQKLSAEGLKDLLTNTTDTFQSNGFLSFTTNTEYGTYSHSKGVKIHLVMPPNQGGGAWIGEHFNSGEREFLLNSNSVLRFDPNSVHSDEYGIVHVNAVWVGQAADQAFKQK